MFDALDAFSNSSEWQTGGDKARYAFCKAGSDLADSRYLAQGFGWLNSD